MNALEEALKALVQSGFLTQPQADHIKGKKTALDEDMAQHYIATDNMSKKDQYMSFIQQRLSQSG